MKTGFQFLPTAVILISSFLLEACQPSPPSQEMEMATPFPIPASPVPLPTPTPDITSLFQSVCEDGTVIPESAVYNADHTPHLIGLGGPYSLTDSIPEEWLAKTVDQAEFVICASEEETLVQSCAYQGNATVTRYRYDLNLHLVLPKTMQEIEALKLKGSEPESCPSVIIVTTDNPSTERVYYGDHVSEFQLMPVLEQYVLGSRILDNPKELDFALAFSPRADLLATAGNFITLWDLRSGQILRTLVIPSSKISTLIVEDLEFSPDGKYLASARGDKTAALWDVQTGQSVYVLTDLPSKVLKLAFSPDEASIAMGQMDGTITLRDTVSGGINRTLKAWFILDLFFSPDGKFLIVRDSSGIAIWDLGSGQTEPTRWDRMDMEDLFLGLEKDGKTLVYGVCNQFDDHPHCIKGEIRFLDLHTGALLRSLPLPPMMTDKLFLSPDATLLASIWCHQPEITSCEASQLDVWSLETGSPVVSYHRTDDFFAAAFSPDEKSLAATGWGSETILWDLPIP